MKMASEAQRQHAEAMLEHETPVIQLVGVFEGKIVDVGFDRLTIMMAGAPAKGDDFEELIRVYGIVELQRTGRVALPMLDRSEGRSTATVGGRALGFATTHHATSHHAGSDHTEKAG